MSRNALERGKGGHDMSALLPSCVEVPAALVSHIWVPRQKSKKGDVAARAGTGAKRPPRGVAKRRPKLELWTLNTQTEVDPAFAVPIRLRWMDESHSKMRNAAWFVRNARMTGQDENKMMALLCLEVRNLVNAGEPLESVVPSLADLFLRP
jgi:hypothetical protein